MNKKTKTMDLKGQDYAKVPERVKEFRTACPNGLIETFPELQDEGKAVLFRAHVLKDKSDPNSAEATAHAIGKLTGDKSFEKVETIAVGRALALLGYLANGEIASSEEMERFHEYQEEQKEQWQEELQKITTVEELKDYYQSNQGLGKDFTKAVTDRKKTTNHHPQCIT